jgi:4-hydroxybenzoate polyprenyltransferase
MTTIFRSVIGLTRWKEFLPFVVPLTILGALLARFQTQTEIDYRLIPVVVANIFAVAYAFMINDIEDAPDDALDKSRAHKNVIASGRLHARHGYLACQIAFIIAVLLYLQGGIQTTIIGVAALLLSHFYSWKPIRLKAWPVTDVVSHALMLSGLLLAAGYYTYASHPGPVWWVIAASFFFSAYGQLYNQLRDFKTDKLAKLHNTSILVGEDNTRLLMYGSLVLAGVSLLVAVYKGVFPWWIIAAMIICVPISRMRSYSKDARGSASVDPTGKMQMTGTIIMNLIALLWLIQAILAQVIF